MNIITLASLKARPKRRVRKRNPRQKRQVKLNPLSGDDFLPLPLSFFSFQHLTHSTKARKIMKMEENVALLSLLLLSPLPR